MIGVLIVDDEMIIRYGIKSMIDWKKLGMIVVGDAANGKEALELFNAHKPDIVITDIKMPIMDGIELIRHIRKENSDTKIIILSCLQDFAHAKEAIRLGASEYLVKSDMMPSDIEEVLVTVKETIDIEKTKQEHANVSRMNAVNLEIRKENFLWDMVQGAVTSNEEAMSALEILGLDYLKYGIYVLVAGIDYYEQVIGKLNEQQKKGLMQKILNIAKKVILDSPSCDGDVFPGNPGEVVVFLSFKQDRSAREIYDILYVTGESIIRLNKAETDCSISVGLSNFTNKILDIKEGYSQALTAYKNKIFCGCGRVISYQEVQNAENLRGKAQINFKELQENVYSLKRDAVNCKLDAVFDKIIENKDFEGANLLSMELVFILNTIYSDACRDSEEVFNKKKEYYDQVKHLETLEDIRNWFKQSFKQIIDYVSAVYNDDKNIIAKAVNFANSNFNRDISLQTISDHVHLSKNYFVNLFKKETGESFIKYLTKVRVEKAKALLRSSDTKTNEVAQQVGIEDPRYFTKVFKKVSGFTPTEYKEISR